MTKVLLIGSEGFIGRHLRAGLQAAGYEVHSAGTKAISRPLYYQIDRESPNMLSLLAAAPFAVCINASGIANVKLSYAHPQADFNANTVNVFRILDAIRQVAPQCRFFNLSSAAVYGNQLSGKRLEESAALQPMSPYGMHKWYAEKICDEYRTSFSIPACSLRLFSVYGEGHCKLLFWDMWEKYRADASLVTLHGSGAEERDFIYIEDLVQAILLLLQQATVLHPVLNIGNGQATTIREAATTFFSILDPKTALHFSAAGKAGDPDSLVADNTILQSFGYQPRFSLQAGLTNFIQWLQQEK
jgi:UDP-glucose 4-epimerase